MSSCCSPSSSSPNSSSSCGTAQTPATIACPKCRRLGVTVTSVTPSNTLRREARAEFDANVAQLFCETPECDVVYYNGENDVVFTRDDLKNRVMVKDDSPETPLCYCFKVLKQQALDEIAATGSTNVFNAIQAKMKPGQSCFCEKANPRGDTCSKDIKDWLLAQGIEPEIPPASSSGSGCGCSC